MIKRVSGREMVNNRHAFRIGEDPKRFFFPNQRVENGVEYYAEYEFEKGGNVYGDVTPCEDDTVLDFYPGRGGKIVAKHFGKIVFPKTKIVPGKYYVQGFEDKGNYELVSIVAKATLCQVANQIQDKNLFGLWNERSHEHRKKYARNVRHGNEFAIYVNGGNNGISCFNIYKLEDI